MIKEGKELNDVVCTAYRMGCDQTREVYQKRIEKLEAALQTVKDEHGYGLPLETTRMIDAVLEGQK
jgi:nickel-dependent lactate racemase